MTKTKQNPSSGDPGSGRTEDSHLPAACRECLWLGAVSSVRPNRCPACGSGRLITLAALLDLAIAHVDCDAFYAAIEKRDDPSLADKPVIVGGGRRGVVSTCCYLARTFGVRSAMPMFKALKACPHAVVIKGRMDVYIREGRRIRQMMQELTPLVEPVSIDEAYLDLSGTSRLHGAPPVLMLMNLQKRVEAELGLSISIGLSSNKFLAKTASEADKPRGFFVISSADAAAYLAPRSVRVIGGVGAQFAKKLAQDGLVTIGDIQKADLRQLLARYGETGQWLHDRAFGRHDRPVDPDGDRKSVSSETTFDTDISDRQLLEDILWRLAQKTADRAKHTGVEGRVITLKLKTHDFRTLSRRTSLAEGTQLAQVIFRTAKVLLMRETGVTKYRLIGVGISDLHDARPDAGDLADPKVAKRAAAERAADKAREKFGGESVMTGRGARYRHARDRR